MPACAMRSSTWSISGLPLSTSNGFGNLPLSGAIRVPRPALKTIAVSSTRRSLAAIILVLVERLPPAQAGREVGSIPRRQGRQRRLSEVAIEISPRARNVLEIVGLAVALQQPHPQPEQARVALRPKQGISLGKLRPIEGGLDPGRLGAIIGKELALERRWHIEPRVLKQRNQIEGPVFVEGILKIEYADA